MAPAEHGQQQVAGAARRLDDAEHVVGPGDEQEGEVDDPDAVLLEEARHLEVHAGEALEPLADHRVRAHGAPEAREEEVGERQQRPPEDPDDGRAEVVGHGRRAEQRRQHDGGEDDEPGELEDAGVAAAAEHPADPADVEQVRLGAGGRQDGRRASSGAASASSSSSTLGRRGTRRERLGHRRAAPRHPGHLRRRARRRPCGAQGGASWPPPPSVLPATSGDEAADHEPVDGALAPCPCCGSIAWPVAGLHRAESASGAGRHRRSRRWRRRGRRRPPASPCSASARRSCRACRPSAVGGALPRRRRAPGRAPP